jgi:hypothetical protein
MMNPLLYDLVLYLQSKGLVQEDGVDVFRDYAPDQPEEIVVLGEYSGDSLASAGYGTIAVPTNLSHRSIQVLARSMDADKARDKAQAIFKAFLAVDEAARIDFTDERWGQVYLRQSPFRVKNDQAGRVYYGFNMGVTTQIE